ncbi:hypothetical protein BDW62DRAFT_203851 [Aspergillus aurantiobrunneus]
MDNQTLPSKEPNRTTTAAGITGTTSNGPNRSFRSFIWDTDTHLKTPQERRLLLKRDASILTIGCRGFFMKYTILWLLYGSSCGGNGYFAIWLKSESFSVADRNVIPTGAPLISAAGLRANASKIIGLLPHEILAFWPSSLALEEFAFLTASAQVMASVFYTWANEVCAGNSEERAVVISSMNGFQYAVAAWLPIVIFPQTMAPSFRYGFPTTFGLVIASILAVIVIQLFVLRDERREATDGDV